ncbi:MAG TPA: hypothetical protein VMI92_13955 [Steroidobacteraceae bacterium]|nr:hypothetical protein [Steroidobacteraceae bacterium]
MNACTTSLSFDEDFLPTLRHPVAMAGSNMMCPQSSTVQAAVGVAVAVGIAIGVAVNIAVHAKQHA